MARKCAFSIRNVTSLTPVYNVESKLLEGPKAHFGFKNSESFDCAPSSLLLHCPTVSVRVPSKSGFKWSPAKQTINAADKNYWKCNLPFICAS